jgi:hypothetical protein
VPDILVVAPFFPFPRPFIVEKENAILRHNMDLNVFGEHYAPPPPENKAFGTTPGGMGDRQTFEWGHLAERPVDPSPGTILILPQTLHCLTIFFYFSKLF